MKDELKNLRGIRKATEPMITCKGLLNGSFPDKSNIDPNML